MTDSPPKAKNPVSGFLSYFYGNFIVLLLGFLQTPIVTRFMTREEYAKTGMFETAVSVIYIFAILGMDQAYIRYYYKHGINRGRLLKSCLGLSLLIVALLLAGYLIFSGEANLFLFDRTGTDITILVAAYTLICVFERYFFLYVRMQQNGKLYSNINITQKALNIALIPAFFFLLGNDFRVVLYAMTLSWGSTTLFLMIRYFVTGRWAETVELTAADGDTAPEYPLKELLSYGAPYVLVLLMEWLLSSCDKVALRTLSGFEELGVYTAAMKIVVLLITFKTTFVAFWSPVAMEKYENASYEECRSFFKKAFDITRLLCMAGAAVLIIFKDLLCLILGADFRGAGVIIPFLTLMPVFAMLFEITNQGIKFKSKNMYLNVVSLCAIAVNIGGNLALVPALGGRGAAIATGLSYIIYFIAGSAFAEKFYHVGYDHVRTAISGSVLVCYAAVASFAEKPLIPAVSGVMALCLICAVEKESLKAVLIFAKKKLLKHED